MRPFLIPLVAACAPRASTPPARLVALDSPIAPAAHGTDVQADLGHVGTMWGPELVNGGSRLRHAVSSAVVVEGEAGVMRVLNAGEGGPRNAYSGRGGIMLRSSGETGLSAALSAGLGGGYASVAGGWGSVDVGGALAGTHRWFRPVVAGDASYNRPFGDKRFVVVEPDGTPSTLHLTQNVSVRGTLAVELGPTDRTVIVGLSVMRIVADSSGVIPEYDTSPDEVFVAIGGGFRATID